jgi:hypothetical protein
MGKRNKLKRWEMEGEGGKGKKYGTLTRDRFKKTAIFTVTVLIISDLTK